MTTYFQCRLQRGDTHTVAWIDSRGAKVGAFIVLKLEGGDELWNVAAVYPGGLDGDVLHAKQKRDRNALPSIKPAQHGEKL